MQTVTNRRELVTTAEAAELLGTTAGTLTTWRCTRKIRVPFVRVGRNVRYRRQDLERFLEAVTVDAVEVEALP